MNPASRNDHCVTLIQIHFGDLVDHVAKPCVTLDLASGPAFVGGKISDGWANEEENLEK
jgi:hypothetical protein